MEDTLKLALRISAIDLFSGVLRRFRSEIVGTGKEAEAMQRRYDSMVNHMQAGMRALAVAGYGFEKLKPAVGAAMDVQTAIAKMGMILQRNTGITAGYNKELKSLVDNAYAVTNATKDGLKFPAAQVMNVQAQLLQAGVPLSAILDRTDKQGHVHHGAAYMTELLAETKGKDPTWVAQNVENLAHSFQIGPDQYGQIADTIAKASQLGTGSLDQLFYNLDQSGALAHLMGHMSLQQTAIVMKDLAPYGESAGNEFGEFLQRLTGGSYRGAKWMKKSGLDFYDNKGSFIGVDASLDQIADKYGAGKVSQKEFNTRLGRAFGQGAIKVLDMLLAPSAPGVKSYQEMKAAFNQQAGLVAQNRMISNTQGFQGEKFTSALQNLGSKAFAPLIAQTTHATTALNKLADSAAGYATNHPTFDKIASGGAVAGLAAIAGYGGYRLLRGGIAGAPFLKRLLRGGAGDVAGIAEGKLVEKVSGVTPVFVTNWPAGGFGGGVGGGALKTEEAAAEGATTAGIGRRIARRVATRAGLLGTGFAALGGGGAMGAAIAGGGVALAAGGGYLFGHEISKHLIEPHAGVSDAIGGSIAHVLAFFGNKNAQDAIDERKKLAKTANALTQIAAKPAKVEGGLKITLDDRRAKVSGLHTNQPGFQLEVGYLGLVP